METVRNLLDGRPAMTYACAGATASVSLYMFWRSFRKSPPAVTASPGTVILHQPPRATLAPSLSNFPIKLETFLRLTDIPYVNDFKNYISPKGKVPYITLDGVVVSDSQLSIEYLKEKLKVDLNKNLSVEQKAVSQALRVMLEEHLYWGIVYFRWVEETYDQKMIREYFKMPTLLFMIVRRKMRNQTYYQGMGRHTRDEVLSFMTADLAALNDYLGDKDFLMGDRLTEVDCSAFGILCQLIYMQDDKFLQGLVQAKFPSLLRYTERIKAKVWPDWDKVIRNGSNVKNN